MEGGETLKLAIVLSCHSRGGCKVVWTHFLLLRGTNTLVPGLAIQGVCGLISRKLFGPLGE